MTGPDEVVGQAEAILRAACGDRVRTRFVLAPLTTFRIGGPAALFRALQQLGPSGGLTGASGALVPPPATPPAPESASA